MPTVVPILLTSVLAQQAPTPPADPQLEAWRDHIVPTATEWRWQEIDWRPTFGAGLQEAAATDRPLLLWLMNGHPLGCT